MKKQFISTFALIGLLTSLPVISNTNEDIQKTDIECNSNVLHYSASINDLDYFNELLSLNTFTLTDLNHNCDSVYHIAIQNNNKNILETLFNYIDIKDIYNKNGENLIQYSIKHQQPEILIYLINQNLNPEDVSKNEQSGIEYQEKYGNLVTEKILKDYERTQLLMFVSQEKESYHAVLKDLKKRLEEKELLFDSELSISSQQHLRQEILLLRNQIEFLSNIINQKNNEIENLRRLLKDSDIDIKDNDKSFTTGDVSDIINELSNNKGNLIDIHPDEIEKESNVIFNLLSQPIYKLEKD